MRAAQYKNKGGKSGIHCRRTRKEPTKKSFRPQPEFAALLGLIYKFDLSVAVVLNSLLWKSPYGFATIRVSNESRFQFDTFDINLKCLGNSSPEPTFKELAIKFMSYIFRLFLIGIVALGAGGLFISESFETPPEGMSPTPMWKGFLAIGLGIVLIGFAIRCLLSDLKGDSQATPTPDEIE